MNRRSFLQGIAGILAAGVAPSILPASSIMRVKAIVLPGDEDFLLPSDFESMNGFKFFRYDEIGDNDFIRLMQQEADFVLGMCDSQAGISTFLRGPAISPEYLLRLIEHEQPGVLRK